MDLVNALPPYTQLASTKLSPTLGPHLTYTLSCNAGPTCPHLPVMHAGQQLAQGLPLTNTVCQILLQVLALLGQPARWVKVEHGGRALRPI